MELNQFRLKNIAADFESYEQLISLYHLFKDKYLEQISLTFDSWFAANLCSVLGGILDSLQERMVSVEFDPIPPDIQSILQRNEFLAHYGYNKSSDIFNTTLKYLKLKPADGRYFHYYIMNELLERPELPALTSALKKKIAESIYELFANAKIHSETNFIYTCGQFFPRKNTIEFTITDTGIGFKNRVMKRFNREITALQAVDWATSAGHTTKQGISGGIGLAILKEFVQENKGKIQIVSDTAFYQFNAQGEIKKEFSKPFPGSIINVQFKTDDTFEYGLSQDDDDDIF